MFGRNKKGKTASNANMILSTLSSWEIREAYKSLRTNVMFLIDGDKSKVIGVTSATPHDGKTINAINHAISFAQIGKKTVLIDADMRLPTVAGKLRMAHKIGLSNYLAGQNKLEECIKKSKKYGIDVLPSGTIPPDPTWLLQSDRFAKMIDDLKLEYDYIIVDLPPVTTVADAYIISGFIDGYLLVIRNGQTDIRAVDDMMEQLSMANAKVIGFINNDVQGGTGTYYKKRYYDKSRYYSSSGKEETKEL